MTVVQKYYNVGRSRMLDTPESWVFQNQRRYRMSDISGYVRCSITLRLLNDRCAKIVQLLDVLEHWIFQMVQNSRFKSWMF